VSEEKYQVIFESNPDYIVLLGLNGVIEDVNDTMVNAIGLTKDKLIGKHFTELKILKNELSLHKQKFSSFIRGNHSGRYEFKAISAKGKQWIEINMFPITRNEEFKNVIMSFKDITKMKKSQITVETTLREKEILLRELHHRVKNNMQIIASLLHLQSQYVKEEESKLILRESQGRVHSMAMIHEKIYQSRLSDVNLKEYLENMVSDIFYLYGIKKGTINFVIDVLEVHMNIDTAIPCGLIINELVTNSLKYAFPNGKKGNITITFTSKCDELILKVADDGIGLPENIKPETTETLGLKLVQNLVNQLDGTLKLVQDDGTEFIITFHELNYEDRMN